MRNGYLVLGMHRSGTSAVSGTLTKLGATPPKTLLGANHGNMRGHWESAALIHLHDELLTSAGSKWDDWRPFNPAWHETPVAAQFRERGRELLRSEFDSAPSFVLKDPRVCRFPRFWLDIFAEEGVSPRLVLPIRQPLEVAQSLKARDGFSLNKGLLLWLRHTLEAEASTRDLPRALIDWDAFLKDWRPSLDRVAEELSAPWPRLSDFTAAEIDAFLSDELKHERASPEAARAHPDMHAWAVAAYEALLELAENPGSNSARAALDETRARFNEATSLFGRTLSGFESEIDSLHSALVAERTRLMELERERQEMLDVERAQIAELQRAHEDALNALKSQLTEERQERDQQVIQTEAVHKERFGLEQAVLALRRDFEDAVARERAAHTQLEEKYNIVVSTLEAERRAISRNLAHAAQTAGIEAGTPKASVFENHRAVMLPDISET